MTESFFCRIILNAGNTEYHLLKRQVQKVNRKELKRAGRKSFHKHYLLLIFLCIIMSLFGTEASQSVELLRRDSGEGRTPRTILRLENVYNTITGEMQDTSELDLSSVIGSNAVVQSIMTGNLDLGEEIANTIEANMPAEYGGNKALGTTSGVLAGVFNTVMSGRFYLEIAQ